MMTTTRCLLALAAAWLLPAPDLEANCEVGAYLIHTVAEYARQDDARQWIFAYESTDLGVQLLPTASQSNDVVRRLTYFLRGPHRASFALDHQGRRCTPELQPGVVMLASNDDIWPREALRFPSCFDAADVPPQGFARFDRDTRTLTLPRSLPVVPETSFAGRRALEADLERRLFTLELRAEQGAEAAITAGDVEGIEFEMLRVGDGDRDGAGDSAFRMIVAKLCLRNLDRLMRHDGYNTVDALRDKLAEFPVIFLQRPGGTPFYIGDGSYCSGYRLATDVAATVRDLGPMERFELTAAYDLSGDGIPEILVVNSVVAYHLADDDTLEVVGWQQGC